MWVQLGAAVPVDARGARARMPVNLRTCTHLHPAAAT